MKNAGFHVADAISHKLGDVASIRPRPARGMKGFTYLAVLATIAIMGIALAATGEVWHVAQQREKERELLFIGDQFRHALKSYYALTPLSSRNHLDSLEDLLLDPRYPSTQRHLRKIYADPISGRPEWGLIKGASGEILGVHSLSEDEPIKQSNFSLVNQDFEGKTKYADWIFMQSPGMGLPGQPAARLLQKP